MPIPNSNVKLVYHSGRARGYLSTIELRLTPELIPPTLKTISLRITIEGVLFEKTFEADPDLKYTYSWNRLNIYRQRVYGSTTAVVKVGYFYEDCVEPIWDVQTTKITGQDLTVSDVGGWDLDVHHRYNPQEGTYIFTEFLTQKNVLAKKKTREMRRRIQLMDYYYEITK